MSTPTTVSHFTNVSAVTWNSVILYGVTSISCEEHYEELIGRNNNMIRPQDASKVFHSVKVTINTEDVNAMITLRGTSTTPHDLTFNAVAAGYAVAANNPLATTEVTVKNVVWDGFPKNFNEKAFTTGSVSGTAGIGNDNSTDILSFV